HHQSRSGERPSRCHFHLFLVATKLRGEAAEAAHRKGRREEGNAKPERIDGEEKHTGREAFLRGCNGEDRREDWADTRRPAKDESKPQQIGACKLHQETPLALATPRQMKARLAVEKGNAEKPHIMQTKHDDDCTGNAGKDFLVLDD